MRFVCIKQRTLKINDVVELCRSWMRGKLGALWETQGEKSSHPALD